MRGTQRPVPSCSARWKAAGWRNWRTAASEGTRSSNPSAHYTGRGEPTRVSPEGGPPRSEAGIPALLLYRLVDTGRGEPTRVSPEGGPPRSEAGIPAVSDVRFLGCDSAAATREAELGEAGDSESSVRGIGEPEREPALKGWKDTDGRLTPPPVNPRIVGRTGSEFGGFGWKLAGLEPGGELVSDPGGLTAFKADIGLVPRAPSP
ncbi:hypothetical protein HYQ46_011205 [Verticillium longisporum]|nr:hypothetical protein HYQ46_011205 [Verticillium longisporum]